MLRSKVEKGVTSAIPRFFVIGLYFVAPRVVYASKLVFLSSSVYWCFVNQGVTCIPCAVTNGSTLMSVNVFNYVGCVAAYQVKR